MRVVFAYYCLFTTASLLLIYVHTGRTLRVVFAYYCLFTTASLLLIYVHTGRTLRVVFDLASG
jgi:hypothetical protein